MLNSLITAISFSGVLWSISPQLFFVSVLYAAGGSSLTLLLGRRLLRLSYRQADFEADFRSELIKMKAIESSNVEEMRAGLFGRIDQIEGNLIRIITVNRNLSFFTTGYNYLIQLLPIVIVAPLFIDRGVEFGIISQSSMAFATIVGAFSLIVTQFQAISSFATVVTRLSELVDFSQANPP